MTAQIIISLFVLIILSLTLRNINRKGYESKLPTTMNLVIIFALLPVSFSGIVVISNFFFEGFSDNIYWFIATYLLLFILNLFYSVKLIRQQNSNKLQLTWLILMVLVTAYWYISAIAESHFESGPTPEIVDSSLLLIYFVSVHITILFTFILQFSSWKHFRIFKRLLTIALLGIYVLIFWNTLSYFLN